MPAQPLERGWLRVPVLGACWLQVRVGGTELGHDVILVIVNKIRELEQIGYFQTSFLRTFSLTEILLGNTSQIEKKKDQSRSY